MQVIYFRFFQISPEQIPLPRPAPHPEVRFRFQLLKQHLFSFSQTVLLHPWKVLLLLRSEQMSCIQNLLLLSVYILTRLLTQSFSPVLSDHT